VRGCLNRTAPTHDRHSFEERLEGSWIIRHEIYEFVNRKGVLHLAMLRSHVASPAELESGAMTAGPNANAAINLHLTFAPAGRADFVEFPPVLQNLPVLRRANA
jgi:hypothetical protein